MRQCKKCGVEKPLRKFPKNLGCKEGRGRTCHCCANFRKRQVVILFDTQAFREIRDEAQRLNVNISDVLRKAWRMSKPCFDRLQNHDEALGFPAEAA